MHNNSKQYAPCCVFKKTISADNWNEYQDKLSEIDVAEGCKYCIDMESHGASWSHRKQYYDEFYSVNGKVFVAGVCFDNVCNLKCITCGPSNSTQWISDYTQLNLWGHPEEYKNYNSLSNTAEEKIEFIKQLLQILDYDTFTVDFFGGEPSVNLNVINFVDWLANSNYSKKIIINVTTNGTRFFEKLIKYHNKFKEIYIQLSVDGIEEYFEFLRFGSNWKTTQDNILRYDEISKEIKNLRYGFHYTMSWMNCLHFNDFYKWVYKNTTNSNLIYLTKVTSPKMYSVDILKPEIKNKIKNIVLDDINNIGVFRNEEQKNMYEHVKTLYDTNMSTYIDKFFLENTNLYADAHDMLSKLDIVRHTNYRTVLNNILHELNYE